MQQCHFANCQQAVLLRVDVTTVADVGSGALQYGFSVFEGLKAFPSVDGNLLMFRVDAHAKRMAESAKLLCMPTVPVEMFIDSVRALLKEDASWCPISESGALYVRPTLFASETFLGVRPATTHTFAIILSPVESYWDGGSRGLRLWAERERVRACAGGLGSAKTGGNYAATVLAAKSARERGFDQVLWLDAVQHEYLEEVGTMNVFVRLDDVVYTPPLSGTILAGVTRDSALKLLREWGVTVDERALSLREIAEAASRGQELEIWGTGTAASVSAVDEIAWEGGNVHATSGVMGERLRKALSAIQTGHAKDTHGWVTPVV